MIRNALPSWLVCSLCLCLPIASSPALGQIVPDNTLRVNSVVTPIGNINFEINGGTVAGSNLFHSFQEFSVPTAGLAFFNNPLNIQNILTRVTGGSISNIDGLLQARGNANLFLLNPNGVFFGRNATLNIGGSFVSSTASSIIFADGSEFSATSPQTTSLLSINVPLGLQFPAIPANIISNGANLQVSPEKTIALVGGGIILDGSQLTASQGRIEVGSVGANSLVSLNPVTNGWTLGYNRVNNFGDIQLLSQSALNQNGGEIFVRSQDLNVTNGSKISVETGGAGNAGVINIQADNVTVSGASSNGQVFSTIAATSRGSGNSGSVNINTNRLTARDGADVSVTTFNSGKGGNLTVNASEFVELIGAGISPGGQNFSRSGLFAATEGTENGGDITINTPKLQVTDGARVSVSTRGRGQDNKPGGRGGNLLVNAKNIELSGASPDGRFISGLFALSGEQRPNPNIVPSRATGQGGDIKIETEQLNIRSGAQVSAATEGIGQGGNITVLADSINVTGASTVAQQFSTLSATSRGAGNSGNITIDSKELRVSDGADVSVTAFGTGRSGEVNILARESVELIGVSAIPNTTIFSRSGLFAATEGTQDGGSLTVNTGRLLVQDGARISASTRGRGESGISGGQGGNLIINASDAVELSGIGKVQLTRNNQVETRTFASGLFALSGEDRPTIAANEATGTGGNLEITTGLLNIQDGAELSVSASGSGPAGRLQVQAQSVKLKDGFIRGATVVGTGANTTLQIRDSLQLRGNSQISTVAGSNSNGGNITIEAGAIAILENSSIKADAGRQGGNVRITTQGLFAFPFAITASSELGTQFNGLIEINLPDVGSNQELTDVPTNFFSPENQVASACTAEVGKNRNQFFITGRGGLPPSPTEPLKSESVRVSAPSSNEQLPATLVNYPRPATGWGVNNKGEILLTANTVNTVNTVGFRSSTQPTANCHAY
ncbi:filamentous hemagglutinin N-terminal domain-containing protein [Dulcicalothrix desertica]|uniref:two-partner secretion domain-containing protein n=1 Tax=Dulcicalothrix desertica TaxID=32056 RepID=UPI0013156A03|nr:filamentous hemagglutinin N-terminal domain-containing protein [Dulcicalothrix desertica]